MCNSQHATRNLQLADNLDSLHHPQNILDRFSLDLLGYRTENNLRNGMFKPLAVIKLHLKHSFQHRDSFVSKQFMKAQTNKYHVHVLNSLRLSIFYSMSPVKRFCVFKHSVMTNFNCACSDIQRGQGSGFLSEGSS